MKKKNEKNEAKKSKKKKRKAAEPQKNTPSKWQEFLHRHKVNVSEEKKVD